jgi:tetratricopeptide (TPR) repeat protein
MHAKAISYTISCIYISTWIIINGVKNTMSKRREFLIRLLLITVIIFCSIHASCGQENDTVNIPHPSSLPAKSELSQEDILNPAQRSLDRSISIFNIVAIVMGLEVALITVIVAIGGILGYFKSRQLEKYIEQAKKSADELKGYENDAKKIVDKLTEFENKLDKIGEKVILIGETESPEIEEKVDGLREKAKDIPSLPEPSSEDQKRLLEEYGKKTEFLEAFGVPLKSEDYFNRGVDLYQRGEYESALKAFDKAIELKPKFAEAWNSKGVILSNLGRYDEALKAFDEAMELKPKFAFAWSNKGAALDNLGRYDEALKAYDKTIELKPKFAKGWYNKGVALGNLARYDEALKAYDKTIELKRDYAEAWYNKACTYSRTGDKENALKHLSEAIALDAKYKEMAKSDDAFKNLWDDEDFKKVVS